jgi:hypothetical protein
MKTIPVRYIVMFLVMALLAGTVEAMEEATAIDWKKNILSSRGISTIRINSAENQ